MNCLNQFYWLFLLPTFFGCHIHAKNYDSLNHAVFGIGAKKRGDSIKAEFQELSKNLSEFPVINNAQIVPAITITRNPPIGFKWKTFFVDPEMYKHLGYQAISISIKNNKNDFEYGGDLILTK